MSSTFRKVWRLGSENAADGRSGRFSTSLSAALSAARGATMNARRVSRARTASWRPQTRQALATASEARGASVREAADGREGWSVASAHEEQRHRWEVENSILGQDFLPRFFALAGQGGCWGVRQNKSGGLNRLGRPPTGEIGCCAVACVREGSEGDVSASRNPWKVTHLGLSVCSVTRRTG